MSETDKELALRVLRDTLRDPDARAGERVSAAKLLLEATGAARQAQGALHQLTADELLRLARGEGDTPPAMGPAGTSAAAVPSASPEDRPAKPTRPAPKTERPAPPAEDKAGLGRTPGAFLQRGPKKESPISSTPTPNSQMGPKMNLPISQDIDPLS